MSNRAKAGLLYLLVMPVALLLLFSTCCMAADFSINDPVSRLRDGNYLVDMQIDYVFSDRALDALENGVPLTVDIHLQVRRDGAWIWEKDVVDFHHRRQLRYLPLSSTYEVRFLPDGDKRSFVSQSAAIDALGTVSDLPVVKQGELEQGETYLMEAMTELDIEALPVPLRPTAYISPSWSLSSEWRQWRIRP